MVDSSTVALLDARAADRCAARMIAVLDEVPRLVGTARAKIDGDR